MCLCVYLYWLRIFIYFFTQYLLINNYYQWNSLPFSFSLMLSSYLLLTVSAIPIVSLFLFLFAAAADVVVVVAINVEFQFFQTAMCYRKKCARYSIESSIEIQVFGLNVFVQHIDRESDRPVKLHTDRIFNAKKTN